MAAADWIAAATPGLAIAGGVVASVVKLDRLTRAVERLETTLTRVVNKVEDLEIRVTKGGL